MPSEISGSNSFQSSICRTGAHTRINFIIFFSPTSRTKSTSSVESCRAPSLTNPEESERDAIDMERGLRYDGSLNWSLLISVADQTGSVLTTTVSRTCSYTHAHPPVCTVADGAFLAGVVALFDFAGRRGFLVLEHFDNALVARSRHVHAKLLVAQQTLSQASATTTNHV
jgi:hypothetical protein